MNNVSLKSWMKLLLPATLCIGASWAQAAIEIGGISFDDNAFSDRVLSTDFTGELTGCTGSTPSTIDEAIAGSNLNTWIDYGYHDMVPGPDGDYNSAAPPTQYIELAFTDNVVVNSAGADLAIFQIGTANSVRVALDKASIQSPYSDGAVSVISDPVSFPTVYTNNCIQVRVAYVDLSDLGVPEGESVYRVFLTSPLMENGDVGWYSPAYPQLGVPELAGAAALNSAPKDNYAPEVDAGGDQFTSMPGAEVVLSADVADDGLPADTQILSWSQVSGPGSAVFAAQSSAESAVTFPVSGTYVLALDVSDGMLSTQDTLTVIVTGPDSDAPTTPLSFNAETLSNKGVALGWEASTDDNVVVQYNIYRNDVLISSTDNLSFTDFSVESASSYVYTVAAQDQAGNVSGLSEGVVVTLSEPLLAVRVSSGADDAEEFEDGGVDRNGSDLELVEDGNRGAQVVGLRFQGVSLPAGAEVVRAWIEFGTDETSSGPVDLTIQGLAEDSPAQFGTEDFAISSRPTTSSSVAWSGLPDWDVVGERHKTTDVSVIVQELIDRAGWSAGNSMGFVFSGTGHRVAESYQGSRFEAPNLFVEYVLGPPVNQAPEIDAGSDGSFELTEPAYSLSGSVSDDGLPSGVLMFSWELVSGPAMVAFVDSTALQTEVSFSAAGNYVLNLTASDGELMASDTVEITVYEPDTVPPTLPSNVQLSAAANGSVSISWAESVDATGVAQYRVYRDGVEIAQTVVTNYLDSGLAELTEYSYQVAAEDVAGNLSARTDIQSVMVPSAPLPGTILQVSISSGDDDAEEADDGRIDLGSSDLELVDENGMGNQHVGLRFADVQIPQGALIVDAWLEFETDETDTSATSLSISVMSDANVPAFTSAYYDVSSRGILSSVVWNDVEPWTVVSEKHQSPSIATLVQAAVDNAGWAFGNAMGFVITGSGTRTAESYNGERANAVSLFIEYHESAPVNQAPTVDAGADVVVALPNTAQLSGVVGDDGLSGMLTLEWSVVSGPGMVEFSAAGSATAEATFLTAGEYVLQLLADDGEFSVSDTVAVSVSAPDYEAPTVPEGLAVSISGIDSMSVSWSAATDNVGVSAYRIYRDGMLLTEVSELEYLDMGLSSATYYEYRVSAVDVSGNESLLSSVVGETTPYIPTDVLSFEARIESGNDDAEEASDGRVVLNSTDLELVDENGMGNQHVGLRFTDIQIPAGAIITSAYLQLQADEAGSVNTNLTISAIDEASVLAFENTDLNLSTRSLLGAVQWNDLPAWNVNEDHISPDIATLVQSIINNPGWASGNALGFVITGTGTRTAESYNGERAAAPLLHVEYYEGDVVNQAPVVDAGSNAAVSLSSPLLVLQGSFTDDELTATTVEWSLVSGPAAVAFSAYDVLEPTVQFAQPGTYTLMLTVDDGEFSVSDQVEVLVTEPDAVAPQMPDNLQAVANFGGVYLTWNEATDNVAVVGYRIYRDAILLAQVEELSYTDTGLDSETYFEYQVSAIDAAGNESPLSVYAGVTTPVIPEEVLTLDVMIDSGADDVEEADDGRMELGSSDLELVDENGMGNQQVGLRFTGVQLPAGSVITNAWLEFVADEAGSGDVALNISILDDTNVQPFTDDAYNVSSRPAYGLVEWNSLPDWAVNDVHQSPDLSALVQAVVNNGWIPGNAMGFVISGSGTRTAESYNGERQSAVKLHIEYFEGDPVNMAPVVEAGSDQVINLLDVSTDLNAQVMDDGVTAGVDVQWSLVAGPGSAVFADPYAAATTVSFDAAGVYEFQLMADDGEFEVMDSLLVTVQEPDYEAPTVPQNVIAEVQSDGSIQVDWDQSTDNLGVAGYWVYRDGVLVSDQESAGGFVDSGLGIGTYTYVVGAYDSAGNQSDESLPVDVSIEWVAQMLEVRVGSSNDDAEEQMDGSIQLTSTDLEIVDEVGYSLQTVGVRFQDVEIPLGAEITRAYIEFVVDEASGGVASIDITAEDSANPVEFGADAYNITNRVTLSESVHWDITNDWSVGEEHASEDISSLIQVLVDRGDWVSGGSMSFIFTGAGTRTVESYNGSRQSAPLLHIEYR